MSKVWTLQRSASGIVRSARWNTGCYLTTPDMILLRTLAVWVGCGVASLFTLRTQADDETPTESRTHRADRFVQLEFVTPEIEATPLTMKGPHS